MDENEDEDEEQDNQLKLLNIITEFKKKAAKSKRSAAFNKQVAAEFVEVREKTEAFVKDMNAYIDQVLVDTSEMRDKEKMGERRLAQDAQQWRTTSVRIITTPDGLSAALAMVPSLLKEISFKRSQEVNDGCERVESQPALRERHRRRLMRKAKSDLKSIAEEEQVASDARALIKQYKNLIRL
ncbi:hypothetical protein HETIRDRAFT_449003 [Heterobasidion irregulare TC 32-1]|uniref:Uncharacterized protein n=1 Tax=Heterobasidion irregulare (strain TC 32-1) TaxID=747525 RepID=W4KJQ7_HETIT|nr:uncharacterized protein HETIRDRAFT_449003 [Heterobasidion irregulare TC 32-1]ETW86098.1 hypothetical protein HETIRDRAFT_449003 [Heterobasidion irregulare TC 32-1]